MGVPKFYRWISERYPCLSQVVRDYQVKGVYSSSKRSTIPQKKPQNVERAREFKSVAVVGRL